MHLPSIIVTSWLLVKQAEIRNLIYIRPNYFAVRIFDPMTTHQSLSKIDPIHLIIHEYRSVLQ